MLFIGPVDSAANTLMLPPTSDGRMAMVKNAIPNPPIHCVIDRQKSSPCGRASTSSMMVAEFTAHPESKVTKKRVFELGLPNGATIGGLVRNGEGHLVSGGTQIEAGDIVVVFCYNVRMEKLEKFFK